MADHSEPANHSNDRLVQPLLQAGHNCWQLAHAQRAGVLIDGAAYFAALKNTLEQAQKAVYIIGWDIDSRINLIRDETTASVPLGDFLDGLVRQRPALHIYVLVWDFAMIYMLEREPLPLYKLQWRTHRRLHFVMDDQHPIGASHHQKIVVIDDVLAFVGGIDLTRNRWDTSQHRADELRRVDANNTLYAPFHDLEMVVDGKAAKSLGDLARRRWRHATGQVLQSPQNVQAAPWPSQPMPMFNQVEIAIVRTEPAHRRRPAINEVECLYQDAIAAAQHSIYIENQYLTAHSVCTALAARLREPDGPDIVIVLPLETSGWLERATMDVLRARQLKILREADCFQRLKIYSPVVPGLEAGQCVNVHSKLMIVDDHLLRLGSANLSNRSMGLDTECDLAIAANERDDVKKGIAAVRNRLLAEHLDVTADEVARALTQQGSLIAAVESLRQGQRTLQELDGRVPEALDNMISDQALFDAEKPLDIEALTVQIMPDEYLTPSLKTHALLWAKSGSNIVLFLGLAAAWHWTSLGEWSIAEYVLAGAEGLRNSSLGLPLALATFLIASLIVFPITLLIIVAGLVFGPIWGFLYALIGSLVGAASSYGLGRWLGRARVRRLSGSRLNRLSRQLAKHGIVAFALIRLMPVASFSMINLVAGASRIVFRNFILGTALGMAPGMLGLTVFADSVVRVLRNPEPAQLVWAAGVLIMLGTVTVGFRHWLLKRQ